MMALSNPSLTITTIERDEKRYLEALKNIKKLNLEDRITLIFNDALDVSLSEKYDLIFIDAAKAQSIKFFEKFEKNLNPAGIQADRLVGNFLNILWRKAFYNRLNDCFERAGISIAELDIAPLALADCMLDDTRKRAGCLLVDLGAETTTMLVYHKNMLRHIAVIQPRTLLHLIILMRNRQKR